MSAVENKTGKSKMVERDKSLKEMQSPQEKPSTSRIEDDYDFSIRTGNDNVVVKVENVSDVEECDDEECFAATQIIVHNEKEVISVDETKDVEIDYNEYIYIKKEMKEEPTNTEKFYEKMITTAMDKHKELLFKANELKRFKCSNCDRIFDLMKDFQDHLADIHIGEAINFVLEVKDGVYFLVVNLKESNIYYCNCKLIFYSKEQYDMHTLKCKKCFQCDICNQTYPGKVPYDMHFLIYHRVSSFNEMPVEVHKCKLCRALYAGVESLHWCPLRKSHHFYCKYCMKEFQTISFLDLHKKVMAMPVTQCDVCQITIEQKCQLPHICKFECRLCSEVLSSYDELQQHILVTHIVNIKKSKRKTSKDKNVSTERYIIEIYEMQSGVPETGELKINQEELDASHADGLQQTQKFQNSFHNFVESIADYEKQRYSNIMKTTIKDEPMNEEDDVNMHLDDHVVAIVTNDNKEEIDSIKHCEDTTQDTEGNVNTNKRSNETYKDVNITKTSKRKKSKYKNVSSTEITETYKMQPKVKINQEKLNASHTYGLQQRQMFQNSFNFNNSFHNFVETIADYEKQRYGNIVKTNY